MATSRRLRKRRISCARSARTEDGRVHPTPYPLPDPQWDFTREVEHKHGIFFGTREFKILSRNHAAALFVAREISHETGARVTVYNSERRKGERLLAEIGFSPNRLRVLKVGAAYANTCASWRSTSSSADGHELRAGQVAGDALLCRMPCVGGNGRSIGSHIRRRAAPVDQSRS
jgi:hypothetical protein